MSTEAQHKLLSADLEHADPAVFEIIRRVGLDMLWDIMVDALIVE